MERCNTTNSKTYDIHKRKTYGFTIVELVIVIAVIAILAAVLVPTFSSIISKAKHSNIIQHARNRYTEYYIEYSNDEDFINNVIIKHKQVNCVVFINGQLIDEIYSLDDAILKIKTELNNENLNVYPNEKFDDILMVSDKELKNEDDENILIGFFPIKQEDLIDGLELIISSQIMYIIPDFTFLYEYNETNNLFTSTSNVNLASIFILEQKDDAWLIKLKNTDKYLYVNLNGPEQDHKIFFGEYNEENKESYLWTIEINENDAIIKTKNKHTNGNSYVLTYYFEDKTFSCHFGEKAQIKLLKPVTVQIYDK